MRKKKLEIQGREGGGKRKKEKMKERERGERKMRRK